MTPLFTGVSEQYFSSTVGDGISVSTSVADKDGELKEVENDA